MNQNDITFNVNGKPVNGYLALPDRPDAPGVLVFHAWWGLNPFFKSLCDRLAEEGFVAFAPDLREGHVAATVDEAKQLLQELDEMQNQPVIVAAVDYLRGRPEARKEAFSVIGFSMGAAWSLVIASQKPEDIHKVVLFYGTYPGLDFGNIKAGILAHLAEVDEWEPIENVRTMESDMRSSGLNPQIHFYPRTGHWFFETDRPEYNAEASKLAWTRTLEFLQNSQSKG